MAKKFGKFLLFTAAVGTAAAAAYYFVRKKEADMAMFQDDDDDYDDFGDDLDDDADTSRSYVSLNIDGQSTSEDNVDSVEDDIVTEFTPLADQIAQDVEDKTEEIIEEFFDEEDSSDEEPPISDN